MRPPGSATVPMTPDDPVRAALRESRTLDDLRVGARVLLRRAIPGLSQTMLLQLVDEVVSRTHEAALTGHFDDTRGTSVSAWLFGIARIMVLKVSSARRICAIRPPPSVDWEKCLPDAGPSPDEQLARQSLREEVRVALGRLEPQDRQLIEMRYFDDMTAVEIGARLNAPAATVRVWLHRARKAVEQLLTPMRGEAGS
jgi:RNA polymerase sigma factor (sigma-70 family)